MAPGDFRWRTEPYEFDPRPAIDLLTGSPAFRELVDRGGDIASELSRHASGAEALDRLAEEIQPTLIAVLSDINMPGMDGLSLLQQVKQRHAHLPVIMVTAYGDDERRRKAAEFGAREFVTKPVDFDLLRRQLQQLSA